jgi:hypothetical protein
MRDAAVLQRYLAHLVRHAPPQVLAGACGISPATAMRHAVQARLRLAHYAATSSPRHTSHNADRPGRRHPLRLLIQLAAVEYVA